MNENEKQKNRGRTEPNRGTETTTKTAPTKETDTKKKPRYLRKKVFHDIPVVTSTQYSMYHLKENTKILETSIHGGF